MQLTADQETQFKALQGEYRQFYDVRNQPAEGVAFEGRESLSDQQRAAWCGRLREQAAKVIAGIKALTELKDYRPYHELQSFFYEDLGELERELQPHGLYIREQASAPPSPFGDRQP